MELDKTIYLLEFWVGGGGGGGGGILVGGGGGGGGGGMSLFSSTSSSSSSYSSSDHSTGPVRSIFNKLPWIFMSALPLTSSIWWSSSLIWCPLAMPFDKVPFCLAVLLVPFEVPLVALPLAIVWINWIYAKDSFLRTFREVALEME